MGNPGTFLSVLEKSVNRRAFTLIELLIVVAIIGILAAIAVPNFLSAQVRAKVAKAQAEMRSIGDAYINYKLDNNAWPPHADRCKTQHKFITTPIAYMSSSVDDPFQVESTTTVWEWFCGQYHAEPNSTSGSNRINVQSPQYWSANKNASFFILSPGPTLDAKQPVIHMPYDSSNGIISRGRIYHPVSGSSTSGYPYTSGQYPGISLADFGCSGTCQ